MKHRVKKIKFQKGYDAKKMLLRKLLKNFLLRGKIETTIKKAKVLRSALDRLLVKTKENTEANKRYVLKQLGDSKLAALLFSQVGKTFESVQSGFVKMKKIGPRMSDGSIMARLEWAEKIKIAKQSKVVEKPKK